MEIFTHSYNAEKSLYIHLKNMLECMSSVLFRYGDVSPVALRTRYFYFTWENLLKKHNVSTYHDMQSVLNIAEAVAENGRLPHFDSIILAWRCRICHVFFAQMGCRDALAVSLA